jgi:hypothetical protein
MHVLKYVVRTACPSRVLIFHCLQSTTGVTLGERGKPLTHIKMSSRLLRWQLNAKPHKSTSTTAAHNVVALHAETGRANLTVEGVAVCGACSCGGTTRGPLPRRSYRSCSLQVRCILAWRSCLWGSLLWGIVLPRTPSPPLSSFPPHVPVYLLFQLDFPNNAERAKRLVFAHYNKRLLCKPKQIDYESEVFQWDNAEGSEAEEMSR